METVFDQLETGLNAFEMLVQYIKTSPKYILKDDLESMYTSEEHTITKEFISLGVKFVTEFQTAQTGLSQASFAADTMDKSHSQFTTPAEKIGEEVKTETEIKVKKKTKKTKEMDRGDL